VTKGNDPPPPPPQHGRIRWTGDVAPRQWMNFYTKVLGRFANTQGLTIKVSFEVPVEPDQASGKAAETKAALKELGLFDDVERG
jgi:hypothetical protein